MKKKCFVIGLLFCVLIGYCCLNNKESKIVLSVEEFAETGYEFQSDISRIYKDAYGEPDMMHGITRFIITVIRIVKKNT